MHYRDDPRVETWRGKILEWQENIRSGTISNREILQELDDANGYLTGAKLIRNTVGSISPWITGTAAVADYLTGQMFGPELAAVLAGQVVLDRAGDVIERSVYGANPLQSEWVMVGPLSKRIA
ncbi:hypothetical protein [Primorskyibacter marinus]|uniref:hypothetical protein n=1 Tax=Primorskyibacter marinus TaxID=1977320 RepID=UPI001300B470|nr:hypothetical protein [Primorskyibacter marinus]